MPPGNSSMGFLVNRTARLFRRLADRRLEPLGLSSGHLPVLTALMSDQALSQKALTERAGIEQPTMAATLARMERDNIIKRQPDPVDRRSSLFSLTAATRKKIAALQDVIETINVESLSALPEEDRQKFRQMLDIVISTLERGLGD